MTAITFPAHASLRVALPAAPVRFRLPFATTAIAGLSARLRADAGILDGDAEADRLLRAPLVDAALMTRGSRL